MIGIRVADVVSLEGGALVGVTSVAELAGVGAVALGGAPVAGSVEAVAFIDGAASDKAALDGGVGGFFAAVADEAMSVISDATTLGIN